MKFSNEVTVGAPADELFAFVSDIERVAPCLPGASVDGREGDDYQGSMKVKVGPITARYQGTLRFLELDEDGRRAVMRARADEVNGQGNAEARITSVVEEAEDGSRIRMDTDLQMRGRVAQFGRGAMEKISQRMFAEFAKNLEEAMRGDGAPAQQEDAVPSANGAGGEGAQAERAPAPRPAAPARDEDADEGAALDAGSLILGPVADHAKRVMPVLGPALVAFGYGYLLGRIRELRR